MKTKMSRGFWVLFVTIMLVPFQNCSQANFTSNTTETQNAASQIQLPENQQNGTGYGGKTYTNYLIGSNACSDGTQINARFTTDSATSAIMDRDLCQGIAPVSIPLTAPTAIDHYSTKIENPFDLYVFRSLIFQAPQPVSPLVPTRITHVCMGDAWVGGASGSELAKIVVSTTTVGVPVVTATVSITSGGVKREYLMRNLTPTPTSAGSTKVSGNDGIASYWFIDADAAPHFGNAGYNDPSIDIGLNFECLHNF